MTKTKMKYSKLSKLAGVDKEVFANRQPSQELETMRKEWTVEFGKRVNNL